METNRFCIRDNSLWLKGRDDEWIQTHLQAEPGESLTDLSTRWKNVRIEEIANDRLEEDRQKINNILSWIIPILILSFAYFASAFFD